VGTPAPQRRDTVDRLIDGEVIQFNGAQGERLGWIVSWLAPGIPRPIYDELWLTAPKVPYAGFKRLDRPLPNELSVLMFEDEMPLAFFVPESMMDAMNQMFLSRN